MRTLFAIFYRKLSASSHGSLLLSDFDCFRLRKRLLSTCRNRRIALHLRVGRLVRILLHPLVLLFRVRSSVSFIGFLYMLARF